MAAAGFNTADYFIIGIIGLSAVVSLTRGFIREALSLASWIVAIYLAITYAQSITPLVAHYVHTPSMQFIVAAGIIFFLALIVGTLFASALAKLVEKTGLSGLDRMLGIIFGAGRGVLLIGVLLLVLELTPFVEDGLWKQSLLIPKFQPLEKWLKSLLPESLNNQFEFHPEG